MAAEESAEVKAASEELEAALMKWMQVKGYTDGILVDYAFVGAQQVFNDDGSTSTYTINKTRKQQPLYRTVGLLDTALVRMKADAAGNLDIDKMVQ